MSTLISKIKVFTYFVKAKTAPNSRNDLTFGLLITE